MQELKVLINAEACEGMHPLHLHDAHSSVVRTEDAWEEWVIYMLNAVTRTARSMLVMVQKTLTSMLGADERLHDQLLKIHSQELLDNLFRPPHTY